MLLREVRLCLKIDEFGSDFASDFLFASCYVSNYLTRRARAMRFAVDGFGRLFVEGATDGARNPPWIRENYAVAPVDFRASEFAAMPEEDRHEYLEGMLTIGLDKAAASYPIPANALKEALADFRRGRYRNEWECFRKVLPSRGLRASLLCCLEPSKFILTLRLERREVVIFETPILETKPDELIFAHQFKDVIAEGDAVIVRNRFGKPIFSVDTAKLPK